MIFDFLHRDAYWSRGIPRNTFDAALENSTCFGAFESGRQVAFGRVVSDHATFAYVCDVFVVPEHRGRGVGKTLIEHILEHPSVKQLRRVVLITKDAHGLYRSFGFQPLRNVDRWMAIEMTPYEAYEQDPPSP